MDQIEIIVSVMAEGGSLTLVGTRSPEGQWRFARQLADQTPTFLDEEDGGGSEIRRSSSTVRTWEQGLALLDPYPWAQLSPRKVHPEFREQVLVAVGERLSHPGAHNPEDRMRRWVKACGSNLNTP